MKTKLNLLLIISALFGWNNLANAQWVQINNGLTDKEVHALTVSGTNLLAGTGTTSSTADGNNGVFLTTDNGNNWTEKNSGLISINPPYNLGAFCFAISGTNIFAGTDGENSGGLFMSADNGNTWTGANTGIPNGTRIYSLVVDGSDMYAGDENGDVHYSSNNGSAWTGATVSSSKVRALAVSGSNLFAGVSNRGVFLSTDKGKTWVAVSTGLEGQNIYALAVSGNNIFAGAYGGGVFLSNNNGTSWTAMNTGLASKLVKAFAIVGNKIFAGTENYGTFLSTDNGSNWVATGSMGQSVEALAFNATYLFAGTESNGVYRRPLSEMTGGTSVNEKINTEAVFTFSNPTNGRFQLNTNNHPSSIISIYNILGKKIYESLLNPQQTNIDISDEPAGIYFMQVKDGGNIYYRKMVKE